MSKGLSIEELAFKHLLSHPNDKSGRHLSKMSRRFGRTAAYEALNKAVEILQMTDPTNPNIEAFLKHRFNNKWRQDSALGLAMYKTKLKQFRRYYG